jgi:hypothetical protein
MFEHYKSRMAHRGFDMSEMLRMQSNMVIEQTWDRDPNYRRVYIVRVSHGLPEVTDKHELVDVKFNVDTYQRVGTYEPAYHIQFRHGAEKHNSDIAVGSYVYMADEDDEWKWWIIVGLDERPQFRQYIILETNWVLKWIADNKIHTCLAVQRYKDGSGSGLALGSNITSVDDTTSIWVPTNTSTQTIGYNQRFLISDVGRVPALCYEVSKISDTSPVGITKFGLTQTTFNDKTDNVELMIANYSDSAILPIEPNEDVVTSTIFKITYNGTKPTIKVGGNARIFTAQLPDDNHFDIKWSIFDGINTYGNIYDNYVEVFGDYTVETKDRAMSIKVSNNYNLIGTTLTIVAECADGSTGSIQVEVVG